VGASIKKFLHKKRQQLGVQRLIETSSLPL